MAEEDLGLDKLQARRVEGFELLFRVRLSGLKGRHGGVVMRMVYIKAVFCQPVEHTSRIFSFCITQGEER